MPGEATQGAQVAAEAERIFNNTKQTLYKYPAYVVEEKAGKYEIDCCGFVSYILANIAPEHLKLIPTIHWPVPLAFEYFLFFDTLPAGGSVGWSPIASLLDCLPGDIIAWRRLASAGDTGHVFVVEQAPVVVAAGVVAVGACDSSNILHYDDTRTVVDGKQATGVGTGTIRFEIDDTGTPTAFQFGLGDKFHSYTIAIGRWFRSRRARDALGPGRRLSFSVSWCSVARAVRPTWSRVSRRGFEQFLEAQGLTGPAR